MGRASTKKDKTVYQLAREACGMSREEASEQLSFISKERIERIESRKNAAEPLEVLRMAEVYRDVTLCNQHCATECDIGKKHIPLVQPKDVSQIVLEVIAYLNEMEKWGVRLIGITVDGKISESELRDFVTIQKGLAKIAGSVEALRLWGEELLQSGRINPEEYVRMMAEAEEK